MSLKDLKNKLSDGYFKEDVKVSVGKFSLDMLDLGEEGDNKAQNKEKSKKKKA